MSQCPACASFNVDGAAFCSQCGLGLTGSRKGRFARSGSMRPLVLLVVVQIVLFAAVIWVVFRSNGSNGSNGAKDTVAGESREDRESEKVAGAGAAKSRKTTRDRKTDDVVPKREESLETLDESQIAERVARTLVVVELANDQGRTIGEIRGVVVHADGVVLCRHSRLLGAYRAECRLHQDSRERVPVAGIIRHDVDADLALLRLDRRGLSLPALPIVEDAAVSVFESGDRLFVFSGHLPRRAVVGDSGFTTADGQVGMLLASAPPVVPEAFLTVEPMESAVVGLCRPLIDRRTVDGGAAAVGAGSYRMFVDGAHSFVDSLEQPISTTLEANTQRFFEGTFADLVIQARDAYRGKRWAESIDLLGRAFQQGTVERVEETRLFEVDRLLRESYLAEIARLREAKRLEEAGEVAATALRDFERDNILWLRLGEVRVEQRRHRDSITALLEARALKGSKRVDMLLEGEYRALATESLNSGDDRVAELAYIDGIEQLERSGVLRLDLGRLYLSWKAYEDSIRLLEDAKQIDSSLREQADILLEKIDDLLASRDAVVIPIPEGSSSIRADVVVNQQLKMSFLVDTGATYTSISSEFARRLGYDPEHGPSEIVNTAGGKKRVRIVRLTSLSLAGYSVRNIDVFILPAEAGSRINLLGLNFLRYFKYSVDSKRREFRLERQ